MKLTTITLSGANEFTDIRALLSLCEKYSLAELGIQVSGEKAAFGMARYWWIWALALYVTPFTKLALHVNKDWVEAFCAGKIPKELDTFLSWRHDNGEPIFSRVQLNFKIGREKDFNVLVLRNMIRKYSAQRFILSYNDCNKEVIHYLYQEGLEFDCLYDSSFGAGILPEKRLPLIYPDVCQGYAGGLSPQNVLIELNKINKVLAEGEMFYIDAQKGLEDDDGHLSLEKCNLFLKRASKWAEKNL